MLKLTWMHLKQKITSIIKKIIKLPKWIMIPAMAVLFVLIICIIVFMQEKVVIFSYGVDSTCTQQLTLLPSLNKTSNKDAGFTITNKDIIKIGNVQIFSAKTCFSPKKAPTPGETRLSTALFGGWFAKKTFKLVIPHPPLLRVESLSQPIATLKPLIMSLSSNDSVFNYQLEVGKESTVCPIKGEAIYCDIASLNLSQGTNYDVKLVRMFEKQKIAVLANKNIKTLNATNVTNSSVKTNQIIYDNPKTFSFEFDKALIKTDIMLEKVDGEKRTVIPNTLLLEDNKATVTIINDLERESQYEFTINKLEAKDGSTLSEPYVIIFNVSGGPSVKGINVNSFGMALTQTIVISFDQVLNGAQDITKLVTTSGITTSITRVNNQIFISYTNAPICTDLNIQINSGLQSNYGIVQSNNWGFSTRTVCYTASLIGYSKEGRGIVAYTFGTGSTTVLYTGSIHGNELSAKYLMDAWVNELEFNARSIPADKKIVVIPTLNPDGVVANRRNNSNNVDLNRNFPTSDWQTDIVTPANILLSGGGGTSPLSEPETQAVASFTAALSPRLVMSFHGSAGYAIANQAGDSATLASIYSQLSGYSNMTGNSSAFSYSITGTYDDWMRENYGFASVLIELSSNSSSEFSRNKAALWAMARS